jgi:hypothetical protein
VAIVSDFASGSARDRWSGLAIASASNWQTILETADNPLLRRTVTMKQAIGATGRQANSMNGPSGRSRRRLTIAAAVATALAFLGGCGGDDAETLVQQGAEGVQGPAGLCADLALLEQSLQKVEQLSPTSTIAEAKKARDDVNFALSELQEASSTLPAIQVSKLQTSFESFNAELNSLASGNTPDTDQLQEYAATLKARAAGIDEAEVSIKDQASCPN